MIKYYVYYTKLQNTIYPIQKFKKLKKKKARDTTQG